MIHRIALASLLVLALSACGSSDSVPGTDIGVFVDSAVVNVGYRTETLEGVTNDRGEYAYRPGETVTFFIGDLTFPPVAATGTVTPLDLANAEDTSSPMVINIIRLLQSLDQDGDPDNGITITEDAKAAATEVDFDQSVAAFETDPAVTDVVSNGGQDAETLALVDEQDALDHFEGELEELRSITGAWVARNSNADLLLVVFFADGTYLHAEVESGEPLSGMEWGEYSQDPDGFLSADTTFDDNGDLGLSDFGGQSPPFIFANAFGDLMTAEIDEDGNDLIDETLTFERVSVEGHLGAWRAIENDNELLAVVFIDGGTYVHFEVDRQDQLEPSGMEWGDYTRSAGDAQTVASQRFDDNGDTGLTDFASGSQPPFVFTPVVEGMLEVGIDENGDAEVDETIYFTRGMEVPVPL